jgi:hypothetical protein
MALESPVPRIEVSSTSLRMELPMSETNTVSPLRQRMIEDMAARKHQRADRVLVSFEHPPKY